MDWPELATHNEGRRRGMCERAGKGRPAEASSVQ